MRNHVKGPNGFVEHAGPRHIAAQDRQDMRRIFRHRIEFAEAQRRRAQRRAQEHVDMREKIRKAARNLEGAKLRLDIVGRGLRLRIARHREGQYLEVIGRHHAAEPQFGHPHAERGVGADDGAHQRPGIVDHSRRALLDVMAQSREQRCDIVHRRGDFGIALIAIERSVGKGDAELAGIAADFLCERPLRRRCHIGARSLRPAHRIQHHSTVAHADAHDMAAGKSAPAFAAIGAQRITGAARLQSEHTGGGRRNPDRAAAVAGMGDRNNAGGDRRRRAAG